MKQENIRLEISESVSSSSLNESVPAVVYIQPRKKDKIVSEEHLNNLKVSELKFNNNNHQIRENKKKELIQQPEPNPIKPKKRMMQKLPRLPEKKKMEQKVTMNQCQICSRSLPKFNLVQFSYRCQHFLCQDCLIDYMLNQIQQFKKITCPFGGCPQFLDYNSLLIQQLPDQLQQKYYNILVSLYASKQSRIKFLCPDEKCKGYIMADQIPAICILCNKQYCPNCMLLKHEGNCDENGADYLEDKFNFIKCTKCGMVVERTLGCDHMKCRCGGQFCYKCGKPWQIQHECVKIKKVKPQVRKNPAQVAPMLSLIRAIPQTRPIHQNNQNNRTIPTERQRIALTEADRRRLQEQRRRMYIYIFFGLFMVDLLVFLSVFAYLILSFIGVALKGMTYTLVILSIPAICQPSCTLMYMQRILCCLFVLPIMYISVSTQIENTWTPHLIEVAQKRKLFPCFTSCVQLQ